MQKKKFELNERFEKCNRFRKGISFFAVVVLGEFESIAQIGFMNNVVQFILWNGVRHFSEKGGRERERESNVFPR